MVCSGSTVFFNQKYSTRSDMYSTNKQSGFCCSNCEYSTNHKGTFYRHFLTHTGVKPFVCKLCGRKFSQKGHLKRHFKIHTNWK
ncbi:UNVERIFIED_CONTAM: Rest [Trichonephila clavipes]